MANEKQPKTKSNKVSKELKCSKCGTEKVTVDEDIVSTTCWKCVNKMINCPVDKRTRT